MNKKSELRNAEAKKKFEELIDDIVERCIVPVIISIILLFVLEIFWEQLGAWADLIKGGALTSGLTAVTQLNVYMFRMERLQKRMSKKQLKDVSIKNVFDHSA